MTVKGRDQQLADDVNYLKVTMDQVVKPALIEIQQYQKNMAVVNIKDYERDMNGEDGIKSRLKAVEKYQKENEPGVSLSNKLSATWIQLLVSLLAGGAVVVLAFQTLGAFK